MKILLIDIDSKIPNLALKKIEKYHKDMGDEIIWNFPLARHSVDKIYVSCIFTKNKEDCQEWVGSAEIGGTGFDLHKKLPPEIEAVKPRINYGKTTTGCIRHCEFCCVPEKEGGIKIIGDLYDVWDGKSKRVCLIDNNVLAVKKHFLKVCGQAQKEGIQIEFNQGLDIRLLDEEIARELKKTRLSELWFAWDNVKDEGVVRSGIELLNKVGIKSMRFYVIVGFNTSIEEDLYRFNILKQYKIRPYCMRHEKVNGIKEYIRMAEWVNMPRMFMTKTFNEFNKLKTTPTGEKG